ncbi:unnamed protein product [Nyctereutes procyonoides]|uniref:(raccoon dog) hypothetical protein n=1 Tax=Nyctereutes procyonoides TaxID=34880 RepID=A0A811ZI19_NYCPR|nr:unnamed protein product [Nyctereutes procyonoides]CAD7688315.1 unnamed protein product [Nyctereutes procyonoides]
MPQQRGKPYSWVDLLFFFSHAEVEAEDDKLRPLLFLVCARDPRPNPDPDPDQTQPRLNPVPAPAQHRSRSDYPPTSGLAVQLLVPVIIRVDTPRETTIGPSGLRP